MNNRTQLIKLIHVAKRELAMDDDSYRMMLENTVNKQSCSKMNIKELEAVLNAMKSKGFQHKAKAASKSAKKPFKRYSPKSNETKSPMITKIRALWITMAKQGFVRDESETALDAYVRRMTLRSKNEGVDHVGWLPDHQAYQVLESLKNWHRRLMIETLQESGIQIPLNKRKTGHAAYDEIAYEYQKMQTNKSKMLEALGNRYGETEIRSIANASYQTVHAEYVKRLVLR